MRIGERIKQRRLELGYTADALAKLLNKNSGIGHYFYIKIH